MGVTPREALDIVEIIFYVPALLASVYVLKRHGLGRQLGWIYLAILALLRLIGASTGIAAIHYTTNKSLIACSTVCFGIGVSPLLLALQGILKRVNDGMKGQGSSPRLIQITNLPILAGLILGILAGTKEFDSNPATRSNGYTYAKIGVMLFLLGFLTLIALTIMTFGKKRHTLEGENRLVIAAMASLPFIAVRILYSIITAFDHNSTVFSTVSTRDIAVIVQAVMSVLMEFIVVIIYLTVGIMVRVIPRSMVKEGYVDPPNYNSATGNNSNTPV